MATEISRKNTEQARAFLLQTRVELNNILKTDGFSGYVRDCLDSAVASITMAEWGIKHTAGAGEKSHVVEYTRAEDRR